MTGALIIFLLSLFVLLVTFLMVYVIKHSQFMERPLQRFLRDQGVICYEIELSDREFNELFQELQASGLVWYWHSQRNYEAAEEWLALNLPEFRDFTLLSYESKRDLQNDFLEGDIGDYGREITLYGFEAGYDPPSTLDITFIREIVKRFIVEEEGPLKIVINQIGDSFVAHLFVPHILDPNVERLLEVWDVLPNADKYKTRAYKHLYLAALEKQFDLSE